jgi:hypothetical protein
MAETAEVATTGAEKIAGQGEQLELGLGESSGGGGASEGGYSVGARLPGGGIAGDGPGAALGIGPDFAAEGASVREIPGIATGGENLPDITGTWLRGTEANAGRFPGQIADTLRGMKFSSFDEFRSEFWRQVAADNDLAGQFSQANRAIMAQGNAPFALPSQVTGEGFAQRVYNLHHLTPIDAGGGVYDIDNLLIVSPRYHLGLHSY